MDSGGYFACLHDGELDVVLHGRRVVDDEGGFAHAEDRELTDLPGFEGEVLHFLGIIEDDANRLDVVRFADDIDDGGRHGFIWIALNHRAGSNGRQLAAVRIRLENSLCCHGFLRLFFSFRGCCRGAGLAGGLFSPGCPGRDLSLGGGSGLLRGLGLFLRRLGFGFDSFGRSLGLFLRRLGFGFDSFGGSLGFFPDGRGFGFDSFGGSFCFFPDGRGFSFDSLGGSLGFFPGGRGFGFDSFGGSLGFFPDGRGFGFDSFGRSGRQSFFAFARGAFFG